MKFGKKKIWLIDKVEHSEGGDLMQVPTKESVEGAIIKENTGRFKLSCSSPLLEGDLCEELGLLGEGRLAKDALRDRALLDNNTVTNEVIQLFRIGRHKKINTFIAIERWISHLQEVVEITAFS